MICPRCEHDAARVLESRVTEAGDAMRRRRECLQCKYRFTTYERIELPPLWVSKHGERQEPFDRDKLIRGIARACSKRKVPNEQLESLVSNIERQLRAEHAKTVTSDHIGELALEGLADVDHVAYVRFASVYRAFDNVDEFHDELARIAAPAAPTGDKP